MSARGSSDPGWREFEKLVARIESDAASRGLVIKSPDRVRCKTTGRYREVDASIRSAIGTASVLVTIECRSRRPKQDVTWIEQLATKKASIGAAHTIAVSASGFTSQAIDVANRNGIELRQMQQLSAADINQLLRIDFVLFNHKRSSITRVGLRRFSESPWTMPDPSISDLALPPNTDLGADVFENTDTGHTWSVNDLWRQLQEAADPFEGVNRGAEPVVRTAVFPYPGNVAVRLPSGRIQLGDVLLSVALSIEIEQVTFDEARKVEYKISDDRTIHRVEFESRDENVGEWRMSLQAPGDATNTSQIRTSSKWPDANLGAL